MRNLLLCNHAHHGDIFIMRGMVSDLIAQLPNWRIEYAHFCNHKILDDIVVSLDYATSKAIWSSHHYDQFVHMNINGQSVPVINTWVGAYQGHWPTGGHPSYFYLYRIFETCYNMINSELGVNIKLNPNIWHYVPDINYDHYDLTAANNFLNQQEKLYLFCNGQVHSMQSQMDNMQLIIETLAQRHPNTTFLATEKFETAISNIKFTADIFQLQSDLCEISYLSTKAKMIVGKNSGPFTFANTRRNLLNPNKVFVNFSNQGTDTLPYKLNLSADFRHSNTVYHHYAIETLEEAIHDEQSNNLTSGFKYV